MVFKYERLHNYNEMTVPVYGIIVAVAVMIASLAVTAHAEYHTLDESVRDSMSTKDVGLFEDNLYAYHGTVTGGSDAVAMAMADRAERMFFRAQSVNLDTLKVSWEPIGLESGDKLKILYRLKGPGNSFVTVNVPNDGSHYVTGLESGGQYIVRMQIHHADGSRTHVMAENNKRMMLVELSGPSFRAYVHDQDTIQVNWAGVSLDDKDKLKILYRLHKPGNPFNSVSVENTQTHQIDDLQFRQTYIIRMQIEHNGGDITRLMGPDGKPYQRILLDLVSIHQ